MLRTALTAPKAIFLDTGSLLPVQPTLINFQRVLGLVDPATAVALGGGGGNINFLRALVNSIIVSVMVAVVQTAFCAMAAYAFARLRFPFRNTLFTIYIAALMVPGIVTLIPNFILVRQINLMNTYLGIAAPVLLMTPYAVFFLRQFFLGINREVEEASRIDGATVWTSFLRVVLPMMVPALTTLAIITLISTWNIIPVAADRRQRRKRAGADGGAGHLPFADAAGRARLDRLDGRHDAGHHPDVPNLPAFGPANLGLNPIHRFQINPFVQSCLDHPFRYGGTV